MNFFNRFFVFTKRIFSRKSYIIMLLTIIALTTVYTCLPEKKQSSQIRVAIYCDYDTDYMEETFRCLDGINTMYDFYITSDMDHLLTDVKSGYAHCGFYIPDMFFENYIAGLPDSPMIMYDTPSSTMSSAISESLFSCILKVCSPEILTVVVDKPEYNQELINGITSYLYGDEVFTIESLTGGEYNYKDETYKINIPVYETSIILIVFSALLGLLIFMQDSEKNIYVALSAKETFTIKFTNILTAVLPITGTGMICLLVINSLPQILGLFIFSIVAILGALLIHFFIRKSTLLLKVLPLIMLILIVFVFLNSLI